MTEQISIPGPSQLEHPRFQRHLPWSFGVSGSTGSLGCVSYWIDGIRSKIDLTEKDKMSSISRTTVN